MNVFSNVFMNTRSCEDDVVEIKTALFGGEAYDGATGTGPAFAAARCRGLPLRVVINQNDQPLDARDKRELTERNGSQRGPCRPQRCATIGNARGSGEGGFEAFADLKQTDRSLFALPRPQAIDIN